MLLSCMTPRALFTSCLFVAAPAWAIRPFITDDARVVGAHLVQFETWLQLEDGVLQNWVSPSFGPTEWLEISVGLVHGPGHIDGRHVQSPDTTSSWGVGGPLIQAKALLRHAEAWQPPGVAFAVGSLLPFGTTGFRAAPGFFLYIALTENLGENERVLIHANLGVSVRSPLDEPPDASPLLGVGTQVRLFCGLHAIGEVVYGDAYTGIDAFALQGGFRYIINEHVQLDATGGAGVAGQPRPPWLSVGLRLVSGPLW